VCVREIKQWLGGRVCSLISNWEAIAVPQWTCTPHTIRMYPRSTLGQGSGFRA